MMLESEFGTMSDKSGFAEQMPATIGRYQVQGSIGYGAMGAVYKAFDPLIKRTLAIKTIRLDIPRQSPQYKSFIERFYHEARISGTLSHPNIVTLFDIGEEGGIPYLAMEFVEGDTIASLIEKEVRFPAEKVISLVSQIASAIDYAHTKGVIHRDIKPSNLILFDEDRVKVTDFGIAKLVDSEMTQSGTLLGTPSYMSPEQAMGEKLDGRSDIFSLGVCAFEMLAGEQPFPGANVTSILYKLVHVAPIEPPNLEMNGLVPQKWHEVFGKVLAKRPDDRYQTAGAFVQDLEYCLGAWFGSAVGDETLMEGLPLGAVIATEAPRAASAPATPSQPTIRTTAPPPSGEVTAAIPAVNLPPPTPSPTPASGPPPPAGDLPATVYMKAAPATDAAAPTVRTKAPVTPHEATVKVPVPPPVPKPPVPEVTVATRPPVAPAPPAPPKRPPAKDGASTLKTPAVEVTVANRPTPMPPPPTAPKAAPPTPPKPGPPVPPKPGAPPPMAPAAAPTPPSPVVARDPKSPRKGVPLALVVGGAGLLFLVVLGIVALLFLHRRPAPPLPSPVVEVSATPPPVTSPPRAATGSLVIDSQPPGASISINGEAKGLAPIELPDLPVGNYDVRAEMKGFEARSQTATITSDAPRVEVHLVLGRTAPATGTADIVSTPPGAAAAVDGTGAGPTPVASLKLRVGSHRVELSKDGYEPWEGSVVVEAGKKAHLEASLKAIVKATPTPPPKPEVDPNHVYENTAVDVDVLAKKIHGVSPEYPKKNAPPLRSGQGVSVAGTFVVTENGDVEDVKVLESAGRIIDESVLTAVRQWKYEPAQKLGQKVKVRINFKQTFLAG
jgi:TonB family protein